MVVLFQQSVTPRRCLYFVPHARHSEVRYTLPSPTGFGMRGGYCNLPNKIMQRRVNEGQFDIQAKKKGRFAEMLQTKQLHLCSPGCILKNHIIFIYIYVFYPGQRHTLAFHVLLIHFPEVIHKSNYNSCTSDVDVLLILMTRPQNCP